MKTGITSRLAQNCFRESGCPAFMLVLLSLGYSRECRDIKMMLPTKRPHTMDGMLNAIRANRNKGFHATRVRFGPVRSPRVGCANLCSGRITDRASKCGDAHLFSCFGRSDFAFSRFAHFAPGFVADLSANRFCTQYLACFGRHFLATSMSIANKCNAHFGARLRRALLSQLGPSNGRNIKERVEYAKPVLLTGGQQFGDQYQFQNFKDEIFGPVLLPRPLQFLVAVLVALKVSIMAFTSLTEIDGATDIYSSGSFAGNAVNSRSVRHGFVVKCVHGYHPFIQGGSLGSTRVTSTFGADPFPRIIPPQAAPCLSLKVVR